MQEDVEKSSIRAAVKTTKVTAEVIGRAIEMISDMQSGKADFPVGEQSVKELIGQGQGVSSMEISDTSIREFKKIANKYGVDFAVVKDKETDIATVFFKAKDGEALTAVMAECTKKHLNRDSIDEKPSVLKQLEEFKKKVAAIPRKARHKVKEQTR